MEFHLLIEPSVNSSWTNFFEHLKNCYLNGTKLIFLKLISGLVSAIFKSFTNVSWQRCQVHFLRNIFNQLPKKDSKPFKEAVKAIFRYADIEFTLDAKNQVIHKYFEQIRFEKACEILDEGFEDTFQYTVVANGYSRLRSTHSIERWNEEIRRSAKEVLIFPNTNPAIRWIGDVNMDIHEESIGSTRKYIH